MPPALEGGVLTTGPPGKSLIAHFRLGIVKDEGLAHGNLPRFSRTLYFSHIYLKACLIFYRSIFQKCGQRAYKFSIYMAIPN